MTPIFSRILHYAAYGAGLVVILVCAAALFLRLVVMPNVDRYRADIETLASQAVGAPIRLSHIEADWSGFNPRFSLRDVTLTHADGQAPLALPRVDATLSWLGLFTLDIRLRHLALYDPSLEIRRDPDGFIYVADIPVNRPGPPSPFPDWLLSQRHIMISDGRLVWNDQQLGAPPLTLTRVNLILRNHRGHHELGIKASPPLDSAQVLDVRADLQGDSIHDWDDWQGKIYARVDRASASALARWAPWAQDQMRDGSGDLRFWITLGQGRIQSLTGDVRLADVALSLAEDRPEMRFETIEGRLGWTRNQNRHTFIAESMRFRIQGNPGLETASFRIQSRQETDGRLVVTGARAKNLRLEALTALSGAIPMPPVYHGWIEKLVPRGYIERVELESETPEQYSLEARFRDAGVHALGHFPGISGLNGSIRATASGGEAELDSSGLGLELNQIFRQPLQFDRFSTKLAWERLPGQGYRIRIADTRITNADLEGDAQAQLDIRPGQPIWADIQGHLSRGQGNAVWRYIPRQVSDDAHAWLKHSILEGVSPDTRLVLKGPMDKFPFDKGGGEFRVSVKLQDAKLQYAPGWPVIDGINGDLLFQGPGMRLTTTTGKVLGITTAPVTAIIPDFHHVDTEMLHVEGQAHGATPAFLAFIQQSPVHDHTGRFTDRLKAEGQATLKLNIDMPLRHVVDSRVSGSVRLVNNTIRPGEDLPTLSQVHGQLDFTEELLKATGIQARIFGQPGSLDISSEKGGRIRVGLNSRVDGTMLKTWLPPDLSRAFSGSAPYQAVVSLRPKQTTVQIRSDLNGIAVNLPPPFNKPADRIMPLTVSNSEAEDSETVFKINYGRVLAVKLSPGGQEGARVGLQFGPGQEPELPRTPGIRASGNLRQLDLDAWRTRLQGASPPGTGPSLLGADLTIGELTLLDRVFHAARVKVQPIQKGWELDIQSQEVVGQVLYTEAGGLPGKRLAGHFQKLAWPESKGTTNPARAMDPAELPRILELNIQNLSLGELELGQVNTYMEAERSGLRTRSLVLSNPDGRLEGSGWISASHRQTTELAIRIDSENIGKLLRRLGLTEGLRNGNGLLSGTIRWQGRPEDFKLEALGGSLKLKMKSGQFTRLDPGAGRLLGILSLQALPRRIALDFRDVFSEGFAFDSIDGDIHIERGVAYLPDLRIKGPAAHVQMKGQIHLAQETQDLRVGIEPRIDESLAVAGAILGGPAVGVGALVAGKLLQNPVGKASAFEYLITGNWSDPQVRKLPRARPQDGGTP